MKVLASGIDTWVLAINVHWKNTEFFKSLDAMKEAARVSDKDNPGVIRYREEKESWVFSVKPFGTKGYEWLLTGKEFNMKVGNWIEPGTRPSVMIEIGSETLWREGPTIVHDRVIDILEEAGGFIREVKVSRADLCVDILLDDETWSMMPLIDSLVTKAKKFNPWLTHKGIESLNVGTEKIKARLYNKPLEISEKSKKEWMYDVWKIKEVPEGQKVIRVEFQVRREVIKELTKGTSIEFMEKIDEVWGYCTQKWLKFQDGKGKHHNQRKTLDWWKVVQNGFMGVQEPTPGIREKAIKEDAKQLRAQIVGLTSSLTAIEMEKRKVDILQWKSVDRCMWAVISREKGKEKEFKESVLRKRPKYARNAK